MESPAMKESREEKESKRCVSEYRALERRLSIPLSLCRATSEEATVVLVSFPSGEGDLARQISIHNDPCC